ncbi:hypothetical protein LEM8419_01327 [Neolewinella maritima]|uniref:Copper resistance protein D domain-containing protein n=2 Tax=Neolewinella maritima TaxID=1383882 RepID=A0ABN8F6D7_9BACT|nr:hypothetical protein LEM8419_01327 [Neolewinella maritima]
MDSSIVGLVIHLIFLAIGVYLYLFSRGLVQAGTPETRARAESFRQENATWMRYLGLALAAVMLLNLLFDVQALFA